MTLFGLKSDKLLFISFCTVWPNAIIKTTAIIPIAVPVIVKNDLNLFDFIDMKISMKQPDQCMITITDYGKGIENIDKAREPMFSTEAEKEMSGMGFTVMESFMDKVFVKSKPYEGTEVVLIKNLDICNVR